MHEAPGLPRPVGRSAQHSRNGTLTACKVTRVPPNASDDDPEDPFEEWRKRMEDDPFLGPFFQDIDREFERMRESLSRMLQGMSEGGMDPEDPFVYGFSLRMGPDGQPKFEEFGNVQAAGQGPEGPLGLDEAREPLVDVQEGNDVIAVTAELPGVEKGDVNLRAKERELIIRVDTAPRKFFKRVQLPTTVLPETTKATYKNGVLDVEVEKAEGDDEGTEIPVE